MRTIKRTILLRVKFLEKFLLEHDLDFPLDKYHVINKMLIELYRFKIELKKIHHTKIKPKG